MSISGPVLLMLVVLLVVAAAAIVGYRRRVSRRLAADPRGDDVRFTVYRPAAIAPERWYDLLVFAHRSELELDPDTAVQPAARVQLEAERLLGSVIRAYSTTAEDSAVPVLRDTQLTFVPVVKGVEFNPPQVMIDWLEDVHQARFQMRAGGELDGATARGTLAVYSGPLLLAEMALVMPVGIAAAEQAEKSGVRETARPYRKVFASYSHRDARIVEQMEAYARAFGDEYLRDVTTLRSGERWDARLLELIEEADVFQLFWSWNALESDFVRREWMHALSLRRSRFVRPVYWEDPLPASPDRDLPPDDLRALHFQRLPFAGASAAGNAPPPKPVVNWSRDVLSGTGSQPPPQSAPPAPPQPAPPADPSVAGASLPAPAPRASDQAPPSQRQAPAYARRAVPAWLPAAAMVMLVIGGYAVLRIGARTVLSDNEQVGGEVSLPSEVVPPDPDPTPGPPPEAGPSALYVRFEMSADTGADRITRALAARIFTGSPRGPVGQPLAAALAAAERAGADRIVSASVGSDRTVSVSIVTVPDGGTSWSGSFTHPGDESVAALAQRIEATVRAAGVDTARGRDQ
jgi:hypothetical protein